MEKDMHAYAIALNRLILSNLRALAPVLLVLAFFQIAIIGQPVPNLGEKLVGAIFVLIGLILFTHGLTTSLFPLGESLADALARKGSVRLLLAFSFAIGFASTVAEPALIAVTTKAAAAIEANGAEAGEVQHMANLLRYASALAVGLGVMTGCLRIIKGWPASWFVLGGYGLVTLLVVSGASPIAPIALDAGTAATSAINIPLIAALGVGLSSMIHGRTPLADGFGLVAFASVMPMLVIMLGAMIFA